MLSPVAVCSHLLCFFFQAEDGIRDRNVTGVQTCALPIWRRRARLQRRRPRGNCVVSWCSVLREGNLHVAVLFCTERTSRRRHYSVVKRKSKGSARRGRGRRGPRSGRRCRDQRG